MKHSTEHSIHGNQRRGRIRNASELEARANWNGFVQPRRVFQIYLGQIGSTVFSVFQAPFRSLNRSRVNCVLILLEII